MLREKCQRHPQILLRWMSVRHKHSSPFFSVYVSGKCRVIQHLRFVICFWKMVAVIYDHLLGHKLFSIYSIIKKKSLPSYPLLNILGRLLCTEPRVNPFLSPGNSSSYRRGQITPRPSNPLRQKADVLPCTGWRRGTGKERLVPKERAGNVHWPRGWPGATGWTEAWEMDLKFWVSEKSV